MSRSNHVRRIRGLLRKCNRELSDAEADLMKVREIMWRLGLTEYIYEIEEKRRRIGEIAFEIMRMLMSMEVE